MCSQKTYVYIPAATMKRAGSAYCQISSALDISSKDGDMSCCHVVQMFSADPPYDKTLQELQGFLKRLIDEDKLEQRDGVYKKR